MKIIDLLVKISKGKKMPKNIKYKGYVWEYNKLTKDYYRNDINEEYIYLFEDLFKQATGFFINDEVEIIEEPKKIEHCLKRDRFLRDEDEIEHLRTKIDELIDEINNLKGEK